MATQVLDQARSEAFGQKMLDTMNASAIGFMLSIGHRTRLFDTMAGMAPAAADEIAREAGLNERYVREWLGAMVTGGIVEYDPQRRIYSLPPEHAAFLTREATPNNVAASMQWLAVLGSAEDQVVEAFWHGRGVPYSAYKRFHEVMAEESEQTVVSGLIQHIVPLVEGLSQRLAGGIEVLDIGCGSGRAVNRMARTFPASRFTGYDLSEEGISRARGDARHADLQNVHFEVADVAAMKDTARYDLITAFDAIHDQARPDVVLANIRRALRSGGVFLMQDITGSSHLHNNIGGAVAPFVYTISCMHCMSVSLANNGMGLGAAWGKEKALEMLEQAGFRRVEVRTLPHDIMNYYYIARP